jgi:hypothetical protein
VCGISYRKIVSFQSDLRGQTGFLIERRQTPPAKKLPALGPMLIVARF